MNTPFSPKGHFCRNLPKIKNSLGLVLVLLAAVAGACKTLDSDEFDEKTTTPNPERVQATQQSLEHFMEYWRARGKFIGMTAGVVHEDRLVYYAASGVTRDRTYHVGSITKIFTATAVMKLVQEGKLDIEAPLTRYMPGLQIERADLGSRPVLVRHLLSHTSGLPDLRYLHPVLQASPEVPFRVPPQVVPAGLHYRYSNTGFMVLGELVARQAGMPLDQYVQRSILDPLHMHDTRLVRLSGASGVATTVEDLSHFAIMFLNKGRYNGVQVLDPAIVKQMISQPLYYPRADFQEYCGLGWRVKKGPDGVVTFFHIGGADYISAWLQLFPRHRTAVIYLGDPPVYDDETMSMLVGMQWKLGEIATAHAGARTSVQAFTATPPPARFLEDYPGEYVEAATGKKVVVTLRNGSLYFQRDGSYAYPLAVQTNHVFTGGYMALSHDFVHEPGTDRVLGVATYDGYYMRQPPALPASALMEQEQK